METSLQLSENYHMHGELFIQLYGNLFRFGRYDLLYDFFAGWDYDSCEVSDSSNLDAWGGTFNQHISACTDNPNAKKYGVEPGVGRGAQATIIGQLKQILGNSDYNLAIDHGAVFRPVSPPDA